MKTMLKSKLFRAILIATAIFIIVAATAPIVNSATSSEVEACFYRAPCDGENNNTTIIDWFLSLFD